MADNDLSIRRAHANDAQAIGAVFDAAVRAGWTFLGDAAVGSAESVALLPT